MKGKEKTEIRILETIKMPTRELTEEEINLIYNNGKSIFPKGKKEQEK